MIKKPVYIYDDFFYKSIMVFFKWKRADFESHMKKKFNIKFDIRSSAAGYHNVIENDDGRQVTVIWVEPSDIVTEMGCLAHEALHATNDLLNQVGVVLDHKNDETHAYYLTMIVRKTLEPLYKKRK